MIKETSVYAGIVKMDDNPDGTLTVYGKATDDSVDIDQQICDAVWLDKAMPEWFTTGGNIREQHSNIAAGVAEEYERKQDGHYISALIVDPISVKKVKSRVLKGFSIGIKSPRVVRDEKAANGRIIDGQIVEVSLVDRPANPNARLVLAKSASGTIVKTEEYVEKHGDHDQSEHGNWATGGGGGKDKPSKDKPSKDKPSGGKDKPSGRSYEEMLSNPIEGERYRGENERRINDKVRTVDSDIERKESVDSIKNFTDELMPQIRDRGADKEDLRNGAKVERGIRNAQGYIDEAARAADGEEHVQALTSAISALDTAYEGIGNLSHYNYAKEAEDRIGDLYLEIDSYLADYDSDYESYMEMSATLKTRLSERSLMKKSNKKSIVKESMDTASSLGGESKVMPSREELVQQYASARKALDEVVRMCKECGHGDIIEKEYGETAEQETAEGPMVGGGVDAAQHELAETKAMSTDGCDCDGCKMCKESGGCDSKMCKGHKSDKELVAEDGEEELKSATRKCLECGCNMPADSHGNPNVSTAVMSSPDQMPVGGPVIQPPTPKSVGTILPTPATEEVGTIIEDENSDEEDSADKSLLADVSIKNIVEKAVKSAMDSIQKELAELKSAKEAVENKAITLEKELATAKSLAIGGGPKRTTMATGAKTSNEWKAKADLYFRKASETTDKDLAKGYREMARDFQAKATTPSEVK